MKFNLANDIDMARFDTQCEYLKRKRETVELIKKKNKTDGSTKRSKEQNKYLHLILGWFAVEFGNTMKYVKKNYYKRLVNPGTFIIKKDDRFLGRVQELRSSANLTTAEMTLTVELFRNWASQEAGIYLPAPNEDKFLEYIQNELDKYKQWI
jgi:hypothetical protein